MQLYEKIQRGKTVRYIPYVPPDNSDMEIPQNQMITLLSTLTISMLMSIERQLPDHARFAREVKNVENSVLRLAKLNGAPLNETLVEAGVAGWNSAMRGMMSFLSGGNI